MYIVVIMSAVIGAVLFALFIKTFSNYNELKYNNQKIDIIQKISTSLILICSISWILQSIFLFLNIQKQIMNG